MRTIKSVEMLTERAQRKGVATLNRNGSEVYRVEIDADTGWKRLFHYGTLTAELDEYNTFQHVFGMSVSDADSIETFLNYFNVTKLFMGYKPVNGGFYIGNYDNEHLYLADSNREELLHFVNQ